MEFEEHLEVFYLFAFIHCKHAAIVVGVLGLLASVGLAGSGIAFFEWWRHETAIDVIALAGFSIFLVSGAFAHSALLYAIQNNKVRFVMPFLVFHCFLISVSTITALIAVGEIVSDQNQSVDESDHVARIVLISLPISSAIEVLMLIVVVRVRWYIRLKARYLRNGRPPRVNQVSTSGVPSMISTASNRKDEPSAPIPPPSSGPSSTPLPREESSPSPSPPPALPRPKVVAIRVRTPDHLTGPVLPPVDGLDNHNFSPIIEEV